MFIVGVYQSHRHRALCGESFGIGNQIKCVCPSFNNNNNTNNIQYTRVFEQSSHPRYYTLFVICELFDLLRSPCIVQQFL